MGADSHQDPHPQRPRGQAEEPKWQPAGNRDRKEGLAGAVREHLPNHPVTYLLLFSKGLQATLPVRLRDNIRRRNGRKTRRGLVCCRQTEHMSIRAYLQTRRHHLALFLLVANNAQKGRTGKEVTYPEKKQTQLPVSTDHLDSDDGRAVPIVSGAEQDAKGPTRSESKMLVSGVVYRYRLSIEAAVSWPASVNSQSTRSQSKLKSEST